MNNKIFQLKPYINRVYERASLFQIQKVCFICSIQQRNPIVCKIFLSFVQKFWKQAQFDTHQLTNTTISLPENNIITNCDIILTILQSLIGFSQPSTTQSTKSLRTELHFSILQKLRQKIIFDCVIFMKK